MGFRKGGLRGDERPGADTRVGGAKLNGENQPKQHEFVHWSLYPLSKLQPIFADSNGRASERCQDIAHYDQ